jgi:hypothetical protein
MGYTPAPMPGSPYAGQTAVNAGNQSGFWGSIYNKLTSMGANTNSGLSSSGSSGGGGSTAGNVAGGAMQGAAIGTAVMPGIGTAVGAGLGAVAGGLSGGESEEDKYMEEKAQSEHETRRWEERNAAPTAGIGQYLARATALQGMPVLSFLNAADFIFNKVTPYMKSYGIGRTDWRGNPKK